MEITAEWLKEQGACQEGRDQFAVQNETNAIKVLEKLVKGKKYDWANWLITRVMKRKQCLAYAIFAAEQVLDIYEKKYPDDKRPRKAIEAARLCLTKDTLKNRSATAAAYAAAAYAAAHAYDTAAYDAAYAAATAAAYAAAAYAAAHAYDTATAAAHAYDADADSKEKMQIKILYYGIGLLRERINPK